MIEKANLGITLAKKESVASIKQKNTGAGVKTLTYKQTLVEQTKKTSKLQAMNNNTLFYSMYTANVYMQLKCQGKSIVLQENQKSSHAGLVLEFEVWRLKAITDVIY